MKLKTHKPPVKPIGRIKYTDIYPDQWNNPGSTVKFDRVCECKSYSDALPYAVHKSLDEADEKPFKVTFSWKDHNAGTKRVRRYSEWRDVLDVGAYHVIEVLSEHASVSSAKDAMRAFAKTSTEKLGKAAKHGMPVRNKIADGRKACVGDLVTASYNPGVIFQVVGERLASGKWVTQVKPAFMFMSSISEKVRDFGEYDSEQQLVHVDIAEIGAKFAELGLFLKDRTK